MSQPLNEARILLALQALQNNPKLSLRRAASIYEVRYSILRDRKNGIQSRRDYIPNSRKLSDLEEQIIVQFILDLDSRGFPSRLRFVEEMANSLLVDRNASPNTIAKYGIRSADIWNFDETGFMMGIIMSGMVVTGSERQGRPKSVQPGNREWITVIQAINADGWAVQPFIIGAGQYHLANWYRESNLPGDWAITTTQNGWTDNETGLE
ncbi:hypothetical protein FOC4_g10001484 [Fusarium odoratissimum]|uniref:HTH psq-type domain-containing protein n=1 Tax=Fusarium oxysporum f. sp. cubense (strain race 4) TaxID=2502994 RepID=N1S5X8_FUSC4|nr:hypothetical protein FOC4_g10001484 [Fusarium odoratissimum]